MLASKVAVSPYRNQRTLRFLAVESGRFSDRRSLARSLGRSLRGREDLRKAAIPFGRTLRAFYSHLARQSSPTSNEWDQSVRGDTCEAGMLMGGKENKADSNGGGGTTSFDRPRG